MRGMHDQKIPDRINEWLVSSYIVILGFYFRRVWGDVSRELFLCLLSLSTTGLFAYKAAHSLCLSVELSWICRTIILLTHAACHVQYLKYHKKCLVTLKPLHCAYKQCTQTGSLHITCMLMAKFNCSIHWSLGYYQHGAVEGTGLGLVVAKSLLCC